MDKQEAYSLLGIKSGDKLRDVRCKYPLLIHVHHPDVLSYDEDRLYYLVTPLFLQKAFRAELHIEGVRNTHKPYMDATMILHVDRSKKKDMTEKINEEIKRTLKSKDEDRI